MQADQNRYSSTFASMQELQLQLNLMKEDLNEKGIDPIHCDLVQQIKALEKAVKIRQRSDKLRFEALHNT